MKSAISIGWLALTLFAASASASTWEATVTFEGGADNDADVTFAWL